MKFVLLSQAFYDKYSECKEILKKKDRIYLPENKYLEQASALQYFENVIKRVLV